MNRDVIKDVGRNFLLLELFYMQITKEMREKKVDGKTTGGKMRKIER